MNIKSEIEETINIRESLRITTRTYFSLTHIRSAINSANLCTQTEEKYKKIKIPNYEIIDYNGYAASSIMSSVAFLEALINEFYQNVNDNHGNANLLKKRAREIIQFYWNLEKPSIERTFSLLDKYNLALQLSSKEPFNKGITPYQDIKFLVNLRHSLTHYKLSPHVSDDEIVPTTSDVERFLKGKFKLNPYLTGKANAFFPDKCLSSGCTIWAIESSLRFTEVFFDKMGLPLPHDYKDITSRLCRPD